MLDFLRRLLRPRAIEPDPCIKLNGTGFVLLSRTDGSELCRVAWLDVTRIQTYRYDLLTTDCLCLLFEFAPGKAPLQVSEEWHGFADFVTELARQFPSMPQDWYVEVMKPAFTTDQRILFERSKSTTT